MTELLARWSPGEAEARDRLNPLIYGDLRRIARKGLTDQRQNHTQQRMVLVHEPYLRLAGSHSIERQDPVRCIGETLETDPQRAELERSLAIILTDGIGASGGAMATELL